MLMKKYSWSALVFVSVLAACGAPPPTVTSVLVTADVSVVNAAGTATLSATVQGTGAFDNTLTWKIVSGGGTLSATTGSSITYTAPSENTASQTVVKATSSADSSQFGVVTIGNNAIVPAITSVSISSDLSTVNAASPAILTATVNGVGAFDNAVTWSVISGGGTLSATAGSSVTFTSPNENSASSTTIGIVSVANPSKTAQITINTNAIGVSVTSVSVQADATTVNAASPVLLSSTVLGTGAFNSAVTWDIVSGSGSLPSPSGSSVTFVSPSQLTASSTIVRATSVQDPSKTGSVTINTRSSTFGSTVTAVTVDASTVALSDRLDTNFTNLSATVVGTGNFNPAVTWSVPASEPGRFTTNGNTARYEAPTTGSRLGRVVQITATSAQDPNIQKTFFIGINSGRASVSSGLANHSLAITSNGTVSSWGTETLGELCNGGANASTVQSPDGIYGNKDPELGGAVAVGWKHTLILAGGEIRSCGSNGFGQLGVGSTNTNQTSPEKIPVLQQFSAIAAGEFHSLALIAQGTPVGRAGTVMAWGSDNFGQIGVGGASGNPATPRVVSNLEGIAAIAAGKEFSLALTSAGEVFWWGKQPGANTSSDVPVKLTTVHKVIAISAGEAHVLALTTEGRLLTWGSDASGQLGNAGSNTNQVNPALLTTLENVIAMAAGESHSIALTSDGKAYTWGSDSAGQLGDGGANTNRGSPPPAPVASNRIFVAVAAGKTHSLGVQSNGELYAWGSDEFAQLGNGATSSNQGLPVAVLFGTLLINLP
jgi:alpha-tubulin suppressor-like RCC1 family protein